MVESLTATPEVIDRFIDLLADTVAADIIAEQRAEFCSRGMIPPARSGWHPVMRKDRTVGWRGPGRTTGAPRKEADVPIEWNAELEKKEMQRRFDLVRTPGPKARAGVVSGRNRQSKKQKVEAAIASDQGRRYGATKRIANATGVSSRHVRRIKNKRTRTAE